MRRRLFLLLVLLPLLFAGACKAGIRLERRIDLPGTSGRLDHLAIDLEHRRLYVAALGGDAVEVIDLDGGRRLARLEGRHEPQGLAYLPAERRLFVANGAGGNVEVFREERREAAIPDLPDADNLRLDDRSGELLVGFGRALAVVHLGRQQVVRRLALPGHPESFALATRGAQVYVNVPEVAAVVVLDRQSGAQLARWSVAPATQNFPMALDEDGHRLFVAARRPAALQVYHTSNGQRVAELPLCGDSDDLFFDAERQRVYAVCGEGRVAVVRRVEAQHYEVEQQVPSSPGARTGLFVPALQMLFVAAPRDGARPAQVLVYRIE